MASLPAATLPLLALGSLGGVVVSGATSLMVQNFHARVLHDLPPAAKAYNNWFARLAGKPESNNTLLGFCVWAGVFGATAALGRICTQPLTQILRKQFIYLPGTTTPKRIKTFGGLGYDLSPDIIVNTLPLIPAFHIAMYWKVVADGPGRFKNWNIQWNPYESQSDIRKQLLERKELPMRPLEKVTLDQLHIARPLWESHDITMEQKREDFKKLQFTGY